jgi:sodium-dependent dicarboxylate transporter 2/3/5
MLSLIKVKNMIEQSKKIALALVLSLAAFGIMFLFFTLVQSSVVALVVLMVTLWTNEGLPLAVVSLLPIILFPACGIMDTKTVTLNYANPIIYLFLGGFLLAIAVEKTSLHRWFASKILKLFPQSARGIIFALAITSGILSSILSNTTTALLLLPIALFLSDEKRLKLRFVLAVAYGASVGGILTPIGSPPNLILLGYMQDHSLESFSFVQWMMMVSPVVAVMFAGVGTLLSLGVNGIKVAPDLDVPSLDSAQKKVLGMLIGLIVLLLANAPIKPYYNGLGLSEAGILLGAGLLLFAPPFRVLDWMEDKNNIPFRIMMLFGAGFAIAQAFGVSGMADILASSIITLVAYPEIVFLIIIATMVTFSTEVTSNTALISIMLPVLFSISAQTGMDARLLMMMATVCASYAFMLPIATPPNAIAMSSGAVDIKTMARYGMVLNIVGIAVIVIVAEFFWKGIL